MKPLAGKDLYVRRFEYFESIERYGRGYWVGVSVLVIRWSALEIIAIVPNSSSLPLLSNRVLVISIQE